ncbi:S-layer homology domain-containing protein [Paenibacillus sp. FSL K6-2524]|uniref:S-layer homology domain-containing protein n=1 Tax=Paenibacillus sp. FSL K6-2524 TaxID=2954516 RepID=UPI0030F85CE6
MQRIKKPFIWLTLLSLIITLFPVGLINTAEAAPNGTTYFSPDILDIRKTANMDVDGLEPNPVPGTSDDKNLRKNVYTTNNSTIAIDGTYSKVSGDTMKAQIDLLTWDASTKKWTADKVHSAPGTVLKDSSNENRFKASNLTLFPGLNRITFSGKFGNAEGSETFYVLYDKIPYVTKLSISGSGFLSDINLNEGTRAVVKNSQISLLGEAFNTTKATVTVNGGTPLSTEIYNNTLASPPLRLSPGLNKLDITFSNASDSIQITRDVYYFTEDKPFIDLYVHDGTNEHKLLDKYPTLKKSLTSAKLYVQLLVPYDTVPFDAANSQVMVNDVVVTPIMLDPNLYNTLGEFVPQNSTNEVIIEDVQGPAYRLVTFEIPSFDFAKDTVTGAVYSPQTPVIKVNYVYKDGTKTSWKYSTSYEAKFHLDNNNISITDMKYLPDYDESFVGDLSKFSQVALNNARVDKNDFYIMVQTNSKPANLNSLVGKYLPLGAKNVEVKYIVEAIEGNATKANTYIYKVTNFSSGEQKVSFQYPDSTPYTATISYATKSYINVNNLSDGQTYPYNSKGGQKEFIISGEYIGFDNILNAQYFVNGLDGNQLTTKEGKQPALGVTNSQKQFNLNLYITPTGPLVAGENKIEFRGTSIDAAGNKQVISKVLRIYIIDENVSLITQFHPGKVPPAEAFNQKRVEFPSWSDFKADPRTVETEKIISQILEIPTEFKFADDKYTTSEEQYDLLIRGNGTRFVNLYLGSDKLLTIDIPEASGTTDHEEGTKTTAEGYTYDILGNDKDFLIRVHNFKFETPGTHVYNLELINSTGARTNQRLEITREMAPYRLLAPQPTVGGQYVVNKNFIRFDIEAEGATKVIIGKDEALRRTEPDKQNRFTYDYVGLKPDKLNKIKIQIVRGNSTINATIEVYYTSTVGIDAQYMAEKPSNKYSVFNKKLELSFPKTTILQSAVPNNDQITKFYPDTKFLFGIADPKDGVVERRNDYGVLINDNSEVNNGYLIPAIYPSRFNSKENTYNFTRVSDIYWISGGVGELGDLGDLNGYKPATNGLAPYSTEGIFTAFEKEREVVPSQRGTLKLSYNSNVVDEAGTLVTVYRFVDAGGYGKWEPVAGEVNTKAHTITVPFDKFGYYTVMKLSKSYTDITNHPWARNILNALYSKGIMEHLRVDAFGSDDQTTRGEFASLLVKGLNLPLIKDEQQTFFDVPAGSGTVTWNFVHLETAARAGIITGRTEGFFSPNMPISRQDAAVMIARALKLKLSLNDQKLKDGLVKSFIDSGKIDYYALPAVQAVTKAKIMSGSSITLPGAKKPSYNFNPDSNMTRAEAGKIAVELLKKSTNIFPKNFS